MNKERNIGINSSWVDTSDVSPCENPFLLEKVVNGQTEYVKDEHPISRSLSADSFSIQAMSDAGLLTESKRPYLKQSNEQSLADLEYRLLQRAAYVREQREAAAAANEKENVETSNTSLNNE